MKNISDFDLELVSDESAADVLSLLNQAFDDVQRTGDTQRDEAFWNWKYRSSPFGRAAVQVVRIDSQVAAAGCLWPLALRWQGRELLALQACDTAVDPDFRRRGLFMKLNKARQSHAIQKNADFIFNFPNANSLPGYLKAGWVFVGRVPWFVRVMKPGAVVQDLRRGGKSINLPQLERYRMSDEIAAELGQGASPEDEGMSLIRSPGYWRWRFFAHPSRHYGVVHSDANADDFAVFTLSKKDGGLVEMVVVDFVCARDRISGLLRAILHCARAVDAGFIAMMRPKGFSPMMFYKYLFVPVRQKNLVYWPAHPDLPQGMTKLRNWNFRAAMHDSI